MSNLMPLPHDYQQQLDYKVNQLSQRLAPFNAPDLQVFASAPEHYRMRAEFRVWHEGDELYFIMFDKQTKEKYRVDQLPAANQLINSLMPAILDFVRDRPTLRSKLFQVDFLTSTTNEAVISLLYHRQLDEQWQADAASLREHLQQYGKVSLIGRARKQKLVLGNEAVHESLQVAGTTYLFEQVENSFTQPNAGINEAMLSWAHEKSQALSGDLLELYCGNGNFSIPLAGQFKRVLATEISKTSVYSAQTNIALNKTDNVTVVRLAAEEVTQAINGERVFRRLEGIELTEFDCKTVLVDPPRAGLDAATLAMVARYPNIIYISCNPETLADNLTYLSDTHDIEHAALFDQFPFTEHTEAGVVLRQR
ncbi:tRNA (uridine(54)-C5)-methyltransferase TrmA [Aliidiomarina sedimenti]|uniref:tRNA/tmRNA (uracil-C(5))-methyltransferase n=2 Tax=Aliidiomarina sedimenti TaxID=1933879 RepID=A0ABY0BYC2_9GAMM|nr:tRNA (uridine(54)-C5)-methyltransferase TrmA [Aliidiomarina sedimenti]